MSWANENKDLPAEQLKQLLVEINDLQNMVLLQNSTITDLDKLFSRYTDDFEYVHEVYGGPIAASIYTKTTPRIFMKANIPALMHTIRSSL